MTMPLRWVRRPSGSSWPSVDDRKSSPGKQELHREQPPARTGHRALHDCPLSIHTLLIRLTRDVRDSHVLGANLTAQQHEPHCTYGEGLHRASPATAVSRPLDCRFSALTEILIESYLQNDSSLWFLSHLQRPSRRFGKDRPMAAYYMIELC